MKITKSFIKQIIMEELGKLDEAENLPVLSQEEKLLYNLVRPDLINQKNNPNVINAIRQKYKGQPGLDNVIAALNIELKNAKENR